MANNGEPKLIEGIRGGYIWGNPKAKPTFKDFFFGTSTAWYLMPGREANWLYFDPPRKDGKMHSIKLGEFLYQIVGTKNDILDFLKKKGDQKIKPAKLLTAIGSKESAYTPGYSDNLPRSEQEKEIFKTETHISQPTGMYFKFGKVEKPPSTIAREALMQIGNSFVGMGNETFSAIHDMMDTVEFLNEHLPSNKIMKRVEDFVSKDKYVLELRASFSPDATALALPATFKDLRAAIK